MDKEILIKRSLKSLRELPSKKINEVMDFIDFLSKKYKDEITLQKGVQNIVEKSASFSFLNDEEDLYSIEDLKKY